MERMDEFKSKALKLEVSKEGYDITDIVLNSVPHCDNTVYLTKTKINGSHIYTCTNPEWYIDQAIPLHMAIVYDIEDDIIKLGKCRDNKFVLSEFIENQLVDMLDFEKQKFLKYDRVSLAYRAKEFSRVYGSADNFLANFKRDEMESLYEELMG